MKTEWTSSLTGRPRHK